MDKIDAITKRLIKERQEELKTKGEVAVNEDKVHIDVDTMTGEVVVNKEPDYVEEPDVFDDDVVYDDEEDLPLDVYDDEVEYFENIQLEKKKLKEEDDEDDDEDKDDEEEEDEEDDVKEKKKIKEGKKPSKEELLKRFGDKKAKPFEKDEDDDDDDDKDDDKKDKKDKKESKKFDEDALASLFTSYIEEAYSGLKEEYDIPQTVTIKDAVLNQDCLNLASKIKYANKEVKKTIIKLHNFNMEEGRHISQMQDTASLLSGSKDNVFLTYKVEEGVVTPLTLDYEVTLVEESKVGVIKKKS